MERREKNTELNGVFAVDKPSGFTSFDVVAKLRGLLKIRKIGHGGTLDPMATGVLPIFIGKATKAVDLVEPQIKRYTATARFGIKTDTGDITGSIIQSNNIFPERADILGTIKSFIGEIEQIPPMYSAIKSEGKRLYNIAREGKTIERKPRKITVFSINLLEYDNVKKEIRIDVLCSKGSYIRTLVEDIAAASGALSVLSELRRTKSGRFEEDRCLSLTTVERMTASYDYSFINTTDSLFSDYRIINLTTQQEKLFLNGIKINIADTVSEGERVRVFGEKGFLALAGITDRKLISIVRFI